MAGGVSVEDRSKRAESARPQFGECCESRSEYDGESSVTSDGSGIEFNGETDDEDMEDGEMGLNDGSARTRNIRDPGQPDCSRTPRAQDHTSTTQITVPVLRDGTWCELAAQRRSDPQDDLEGVLHVSMDCGFLGERESEEQVAPVLVIRERRPKMTWAMLVPRKRTEFPWSAKRAARFIDQLGHNKVSLRCDEEPAIEALAREIAQAHQEGSQSNGIIEGAAGLVAGQARTLKAALEHRIGTRIPPDARMLCWLVEFAAYLMNSLGSDGKAPLQRLHGRRDNTPIPEFGEKLLYMPAKPARGGECEPRFQPGVCVGMLYASSEAVVVTEPGQAVKTHAANVRKIPESERWDADRILTMRAVQWSPDGSDKAFDIQVGMERLAEVVPRSPREVLTESKVARTHLLRPDFERWSFSEGCPGCRHLRTGQGGDSKLTAKHVGEGLKSSRKAAADARINRALAAAVESHATKHPGVRGILKRASVVSSPESKPQKKIALDTEQDSTPHPSVSYGGSSASGAPPSATTSTDQNSTSDV